MRTTVKKVLEVSQNHSHVYKKKSLKFGKNALLDLEPLEFCLAQLDFLIFV